MEALSTLKMRFLRIKFTNKATFKKLPIQPNVSDYSYHLYIKSPLIFFTQDAIS